jgi:hypothetical protein
MSMAFALAAALGAHPLPSRRRLAQGSEARRSHPLTNAYCNVEIARSGCKGSFRRSCCRDVRAAATKTRTAEPPRTNDAWELTSPVTFFVDLETALLADKIVILGGVADRRRLLYTLHPIG